MQVICAPLGWLMRAAFNLTGSYGLAVILFTLMTKVILLPVSLWVHVNGIKMVKLEPAVNRLKVRYFGDPDKIADEQALLYKKAHYNPFATVIPIAIQVLLLIGLVQIIYHPDIWLKQPNLDTRFLGFDLSATPSTAGGIHLLIPVMAGLAALILSLESVFCVVAGALMLGERMDGRGYLGCALMLLAVLLAQGSGLLAPRKENAHV